MENQKLLFQETYFLIRILDHAIRPPKNYSHIRCKEPYPLWRNIFAASFLQTDTITPSFIPKAKIYSTQQSLQCRRGNVSVDLPHYLRARTDRSHPSLKTQWRLPIPHGITHLSQSHHFKALPSPNGSFSPSQVEETARQTSFVDDPKTQTSDQGDLRSGFDRPYPLWKTGNGPDRLQSKKVGPPFLSSPALFQWDPQGFLAGRTSPWRYPYRYWNRGTPEGILCQIASLCKDRNYPSRQGFLRSRDHRIPGIQKSPVCHCRQAYRSGQEKNFKLILSGPFIWSGDRRVYVSTHEMEKGISFCSDKASHPRRPYGTTHPLFNGQVQLSGYCDEYETDPSQYLEVLQWPSRCRTDYQRTQRGLSFRKNPDKIFCSQRGLFPYPLILLQSHQLVQATLLANGVSEYDA